jgi:hypothetical protein
MKKTMYQHMQKRNAMATTKKNGGEDPPTKRSPFGAPASDTKLSTPTQEAVKAESIKSTSAKFKTNKNYNYVDIKKRYKASTSETPIADAKKENKGLEKKFTKMYNEGEISRGAYKDSLMTLQSPGTTRKEVRQIARNKVGGSVENVAIDTGRAVKKGAKSVVAGAKRVGKAIAKACERKKKGSCTARKNPTLGGQF